MNEAAEPVLSQDPDIGAESGWMRAPRQAGLAAVPDTRSHVVSELVEEAGVMPVTWLQARLRLVPAVTCVAGS